MLMQGRTCIEGTEQDCSRRLENVGSPFEFGLE